jgi:hypothetical protein
MPAETTTTTPPISWRFRMNFVPKNVDPYRTQTIQPARKTLPQVCRFPIRQTTNTLFETFLPANRATLFYTEQWLENAAKCPLWKTRIQEKNGMINEEGHLFFESDDDKESFYTEWGFEPDEQTKTVQSMFHPPPCEQQTVEQFAAMYGVVLKKDVNKQMNKQVNKKVRKRSLKNTLVENAEPTTPYVPPTIV